jgi:hypothetical protein
MRLLSNRVSIWIVFKIWWTNNRNRGSRWWYRSLHLLKPLSDSNYRLEAKIIQFRNAEQHKTIIKYNKYFHDTLILTIFDKPLNYIF